MAQPTQTNKYDVISDIKTCELLSLGPDVGVGVPLRVVNPQNITTKQQREQIIRIVEFLMSTLRDGSSSAAAAPIYLGTGVHDFYSTLKTQKQQEEKQDAKQEQKISSNELKLIYFDGRGKGEISRLIMAEGNIQYEDNRISFQSWNALRALMPFGQLPVLEINGYQLAQSNAIEHYLATLSGLNGTNALEQAQIDMIVEGVKDATKNFYTAQFSNDEILKKEQLSNYFKEECGRWAAKFEKLLGGNSYFIGDRLTLADIYVFATYSDVLERNNDCLDKTPFLKAVIERVGSRPNIKKWVQKRPVSKW